ncbi:ATP-binding protein [Parasediminibacterium sp. JCM 36343]|uniref:GAF domain-containing sensor histidine kinase n=1 Tax=Parasediminibacterium sp. JCM 36343 TaxID=3374279 RepID=UPI00397E6F80
MLKAPIPSNEQQRLWELYNYEIMDTPPEEEFDEIVKLASQICNVPISLISLVETSRQWFKAKVGIEASETAREISFCGHAIASNEEIFEVGDASQDYRFFDNPFVTNEPNVRFYAGVPLINKNGIKLGTLCVINSVPQHLTDDQSFALKVLARQVIKLLDLRLNNKALTAQKIRLKQQAEMQNRIISIIAHDVRSPVASLKQIVEFNNNNILSDVEAKELMQVAEVHLDGTLDLLSDLLEWGRLQINAHNCEYKQIDLYKMIEEKFQRLYAGSSIKQNKLVNLVDKDLVICTDPNALRFIIRNLLSNANKFTEKGIITIYAQREKDKVLISISDTGVGMDEKTSNRLFDGGGKRSTLGTHKEKGSGLGLLFTKDFIDMLGGTITIKSTKSKGTTFYIELKA